MGNKVASTHTHVFTVRVWQEDLGDNQREWRGRVQHVSSQDAVYFRDWAALAEFVRATVEGTTGDAAGKGDAA